MAKTTTDREEIRNWVSERNGNPARVEGTNILRIDYPGFSGEDTLERITWDEFFETFEENDLVFLYEDEKNSRFSKLISRDTKAAGHSS